MVVWRHQTDCVLSRKEEDSPPLFDILVGTHFLLLVVDSLVGTRFQLLIGTQIVVVVVDPPVPLLLHNQDV